MLERKYDEVTQLSEVLWVVRMDSGDRVKSLTSLALFAFPLVCGLLAHHAACIELVNAVPYLRIDQTQPVERFPRVLLQKRLKATYLDLKDLPTRTATNSPRAIFSSHCTGQSRIYKTINSRCPYEHRDYAHVEWPSRWLPSEYGFFAIPFKHGEAQLSLCGDEVLPQSPPAKVPARVPFGVLEAESSMGSIRRARQRRPSPMALKVYSCKGGDHTLVDPRP
ncbi:hypothetical protein GALMADRAFT_276674 [Galerina marginata CBS 339.88]|uniref:Uncharacterized protein n=1 Tax=Galerina marginata (strain CBS 339.88) TaxID=685588 RepID=A0A067TG00_GALM3|nr:hypothetical protein GALMADRAFT_276674 [Galerina marginata CBS 339.88]